VRTILLICLAACIAVSMLCAQQQRALGVRILGLAGASASLPMEVWGACANPASLAKNAFPTASAFVMPALYGMSELRTVAASVSCPLASGAIGAAASRFGFELYKETAASVGAGFLVLPGVAFGGTFHVRSLAIAHYGSCLSWTMDAGFVAEILDQTWIGTSVRSLLGSVPLMPGNRMPRTLCCGGAVSPAGGTLLVAELEKEGEYPINARIALELFVTEYLAIRTGAATNPQIFSAGASVRLGVAEFGYAGFLHSELGWTHAVELRLRGGE
jgi:hypothetical protein